MAVVAAVVHGGMVTTFLGLARSRGAGVVERLLNQVHGTCRGLTRFVVFCVSMKFFRQIFFYYLILLILEQYIDSIFTTNFSKR